MNEFKEKNINFISKKENVDTTTPQGKFTATIISAVNEFQIDLQREAQLEGVAIAKKAGKYKGRKKIEITNQFKNLYHDYMHRKINKKQFYENLDVSYNTLQRMIKEFESNTFRNG